MKVPTSEYDLIDLDAPVLPAYEAVIDGVTYWLAWNAPQASQAVRIMRDYLD